MTTRLIDASDIGISGSNIVLAGAKGDTFFGSAGSIAAGNTTFTQSDTTFASTDVGKAIVITAAGANGTTLTTTIASVVNTTAVNIASPASVVVPAFYLTSASIATAGTGYVPGDTFDFNSGTAVINSRLTISTTKVVSATANAAGSGGTAGNQTVYGTTGVGGTKFAANVTITGGAITAINSILLGGSYTTNPTALTAEPVTGAGLTGATLNIVMGVNGVSVTIPGNYSVKPGNPVTPSATSGSGTGATFNFNFGTSGAWIFATNDTAVIAAATAPIFLPSNKTFYTTTSETSLTKQTIGFGKLLDSSRNKKSPMYSAITAPPSSVGSWSSPGTAYTGDLSACRFPIQHYITGTTTLGQPTSGYLYTEEAYPIAGYLYNASGFNNSTSGNGGRTAACWARVRVYNAGQGDAVAFSGSGFVTGAKAGATNFLANPAAVLFNGGVSSGADGTYLNPVEIDLDDAGFDVAGIGYVTNLNRTNARGNLSAFWAGIRVQSTGSQRIDTAFSAVGPSRIGLDLSFLSLDPSSNAAITLTGNQRIYYNVTATDASGLSRYPSSVSTTCMWYDTSNIGYQAIINGTNIYLLTTGTAFMYPATTILGQGQNNRLSVVTGGNGTSPTISATGTADSNVDITISPKGSGLVKLGTASSFTATGSVATTMTSLGPTGANTVVQEWLTIKNASGTTRYIPCY